MEVCAAVAGGMPGGCFGFGGQGRVTPELQNLVRQAQEELQQAEARVVAEKWKGVELEKRLREAEGRLEEERRTREQGEKGLREAEGRLGEERRTREQGEKRLREEEGRLEDERQTREYLQTLAWGMAKSVDRADRAKEKTMETQVGRFKELEAILGGRLVPDAGLGLAGPQTGEGNGPGALRFDAGLDDDEVLLRFFREVDADSSGTISREELLGSALLRKRENVQMARVLQRGFECDFEALAEALAHLDADDFGAYACKRDGGGFDHAASARAVFEATNPAVSVFEADETGPEKEGRDWRVASRADLERLAEAVRSWPENAHKSRMLAVELGELAKGLAAEGQLDFLALKAAMRRVPRVVGSRMEWAKDLGLVALLARHLPPGTLDDR